MEDVAGELLEKIKKTFQDSTKESRRIATLRKLIQTGGATYIDAEQYAYEVGKAPANAFGEHLSSAALPNGRMEQSLAESILLPLLQEDYDTVSDAAMQVQASLNASAGIGIKAQTAPLNVSRVEGIIGRVSGAEHFDNISWMLNEPIVNFSQSIVDDTLRANVDFQGKTGLQPKVVRTAERKCCEWCSKLEGEYTYPDVPKDVYRRYANCRCEVDYNPGSGKRQNIWTKRWTTPEERDKIEARKALLPDPSEKAIQIRINKGEYSLEQSHQQYLKHVLGTPQYKLYEDSRIAKGSTAQVRLAINEADAQQLILKYSGKGAPVITSGGSVSNKEFVSVDYVIGQYCTADGQWVDTKRIEIHHGKTASHIVPVKEIKI